MKTNLNFNKNMILIFKSSSFGEEANNNSETILLSWTWAVILLQAAIYFFAFLFRKQGLWLMSVHSKNLWED